MHKKFRSWFANLLYKIFPTRFCWADLAGWIVSGGNLFKMFGRPHGCVLDSMEKDLEINDSDTCYCGTWHKGHHCRTRQFKLLVGKLKKENNAQSDEMPF